jgi:hypothetical protein
LCLKSLLAHFVETAPNKEHDNLLHADETDRMRLQDLLQLMELLVSFGLVALIDHFIDLRD